MKIVRIILKYNQTTKLAKLTFALVELSLFVQVFVKSAKITQFLTLMMSNYASLKSVEIFRKPQSRVNVRIVHPINVLLKVG